MSRACIASACTSDSRTQISKARISSFGHKKGSPTMTSAMPRKEYGRVAQVP